MSKVTYKVGEVTFSYHSQLHIISDEQLFQFEELLMEEIKSHKHHLNTQPTAGFIHDVEFVDDNGLRASIPDFMKIGNLKLNT